MYDVVLDDPSALWHMRALKEFASDVSRKNIPPWRDVTTSVYFGSTGTGKTRAAVSGDDDYCLLHMQKTEWWPGYTGQKRIILDEFCEQWPIGRMLNVLDGYRLELPYKGGFTPAAFENVVITTNQNPAEWYLLVNGPHKDALARRIDRIVEFHPDGCCVEHKPTTLPVSMTGGIVPVCPKHNPGYGPEPPNEQDLAIARIDEEYEEMFGQQ